MSTYGHMSIDTVLTFPQKTSFLSWKSFDHMKTIRPKMHIAVLYGSCSFLLGFPLSAGSGGTARLHHENSLQPKRRHQDGQPSGRSKPGQEKQSTAATFSCNILSSVLTDPKRLLFSPKISVKEKLLSGKDSLFPSFLLSDDRCRRRPKHRWSRRTT